MVDANLSANWRCVPALPVCYVSRLFYVSAIDHMFVDLVRTIGFLILITCTENLIGFYEFVCKF